MATYLGSLDATRWVWRSLQRRIQFNHLEVTRNPRTVPKYVQKRVPNRHPEVDEIHVFWDPIWDPIWEVLIVDIGIPGAGGALG